jgi:protein-S-isoprenylcysteine O-methyltransferase Ste14
VSEASFGSPVPSPSRFNPPFLLDVLERTFVLILVVGLMLRLAPSFAEHPTAVLILISEGLTALMIVLRRPGPAMNTTYGWSIALVGTCAPLMVGPWGTELVPPLLTVTLMMIGLAFSIWAKMSLRRSFGLVPANRGVKRGGPYRLVRHPMYFGYLLAHMGFLLSAFSLANAAVYAACWTAMVLRIRAEEEFLGTDPEYAAYTQTVRWRLIPFLW